MHGGALTHCRGLGPVQRLGLLLRKAVWQEDSRAAKKSISFDPVILLLGICPKKTI